MPELVPREDLVQAIALNGIGYNLTRAVGPAIAGFLILLGGSSLPSRSTPSPSSLFVGALLAWREPAAPPACRGSICCRQCGPVSASCATHRRSSLPWPGPSPSRCRRPPRGRYCRCWCASIWAWVPGMYGVILGMMGIGGVTSGMLLPFVRGRITRNATVVGCTLFSCSGITLLGLSHHWLPAAFGMLLFGVGWTSAYATIQAAAQLVCPPWVRARALSIYQLAQNGALTAGSFAWGILGDHIGLPRTLLVAASIGTLLIIVVRNCSIDLEMARPSQAIPEPLRMPEAPAAELVPLLRRARGRVMETVHYRVQQPQRQAFLAAMAEVRVVRGRAGAMFWQLYEDVAHPEGWMEVWSMEKLDRSSPRGHATVRR